MIAWIDRSSKAIEKQEASLKEERATMNDEQRERLLIAEQTERTEHEAHLKEEGTSAEGASEEEIQREAGEKKLFLSLSAKPTASTVPSGGLELNSPS